MKFNAAGLDLLKSFEGCEHEAYKDVAGVKTIGYGHTGDDFELGDVWTQTQCDEALDSDLARFKAGVYDLLDSSISDNAFSALVCFSYNVGLHNLKTSHLLAKVNAGDFDGASDEFLRWDRAGGQVVSGLLRRRTAERTLFLS